MKEELMRVEDMEQQAGKISLVPLRLAQSGLVETESSSGSSSYGSSDEIEREPAT